MTAYGLLLPHFGEEAHRDKLLVGARRAEELGFDSVWVRDHLVYEPHGEMERPNRTFYEALTTLTAVGAVTSRIGLGTAALIPFRHPLVTAQAVTSITHLVGPRLILGLGVGAFDHEFAAVGLGRADRVELLRAHVEVLRRVMTEDDVTYRDAYFQFEHVTIEPKPLGGPVPLWYCGGSPRAARLAVELCEGWMPGRIAMRTLEQRIQTIEKLSAAAGRVRPGIGVIPPTSVGETRSEALAHVNLPGLLAWANKTRFAVRPPSGRFETVADLEGQLVAGSPDEVVAECQKFEALGVDQLVFDLRFRFDSWFEQVEMLGTEVLPRLGIHGPVRGGRR
ncbi:MAG: LLM class flavin-dependent oxidoreductase [Candidatus Rokubacteria bacterium]|nr:LLM class flavin-dependent oxidoreductase [Candidatus Rokubacteria bacterium]